MGKTQARPLLKEGKTEALVDPRIMTGQGGGGGYEAEQARRLAFVASLCIRASATWRPSMSEVDTRRRTTTLAISLD